jgi:hypothetical protein
MARSNRALITGLVFSTSFNLKGRIKMAASPNDPLILIHGCKATARPCNNIDGHLEDILATHVVDTIKKSEKKQPWFINYWLFAPHHPSTASEEFLKKFPDTPEGKYHALLSTSRCGNWQSSASIAR